jgi:hypothetical protein
VFGQKKFNAAVSRAEEEAAAAAASGGGVVELREGDLPMIGGRLPDVAAMVARRIESNGIVVANIELQAWSGVARIHISGS